MKLLTFPIIENIYFCCATLAPIKPCGLKFFRHLRQKNIFLLHIESKLSLYRKKKKNTHKEKATLHKLKFIVIYKSHFFKILKLLKLKILLFVYYFPYKCIFDG